MLMSELLISDCVVELLDDWDAVLPFVLDFGGDFGLIEVSVSVTFMIGGCLVVRSMVGDGVGGILSAAPSST